MFSIESEIEFSFAVNVDNGRVASADDVGEVFEGVDLCELIACWGKRISRAVFDVEYAAFKAVYVLLDAGFVLLQLHKRWALDMQRGRSCLL